MPLVAIVGAERIESTSLSEEAWQDLKATHQSMALVMVCGRAGIPKTSVRGLHFFAHKPGTNCLLHEGGPESAEHLNTKAIVAEAARRAGWSATVEYAAPDRAWIADVLLEKDGRRLVVEAQWSPQSDTDFVRRQRRYEDAGYEAVWLLGPKNHRRGNLVPSRLISGGREDIEIHLPIQNDGQVAPLELSLGITYLLRGDFLPRMEVTATHLHIELFMSKCWHEGCGKWMSKWFIEGAAYESRCGNTGTVQQYGYALHQRARIEEQLQEVVRAEIHRLPKMPRPTKFASRVTKPVPGGYIAQICPSCNRVQGDFDSRPNSTLISHTFAYLQFFPFSLRSLEIEHLCRDKGNGRCRQEAIQPTVAFPATPYI
jgi:hypothetical protein